MGSQSASRRHGILNRLLATPLWLVCLVVLALLSLGYALPDDLRSTSRPLLIASAVALYAGWFRFHLGLLGLLTALLALPLRRGRLAVLSVLLAVLALAPTARLYLPKHVPADAAHGTPLKLSSMNLQGENRDGERILAQIKAEDADVLLIQEFTPFHQEFLENALAGDYPHRLLFPHPGYDGMAIYSRLPVRLESGPQINLPGWPTRVVKAALTVGGREVALWNVHTMSVNNLDRIERNRQETAGLVDAVKGEGRPLIVAGDFNFTDTTANAAALERTGLADTLRLAGTGRRPTWPTSGWQWRLGFRVDHVYVTPQFAVTGDAAGEETGSDHRPIAVTLVLR